MIPAIHRALDRRSRQQADEGFALILVMGMTVVILGLLIVGATVAVNSLRSSQAHGNFEQALAVAEAGVDETLARLQINTSYNPCHGTYCLLPAGGFATDAAEHAWARLALTDAANHGLLQTTSQGQFAAIRPTGGQKVYAMSWVPSFTSPTAKSRIIKADYLFAPYKPGNAFAAQGNVDFSGSVAIKCDLTDGTCSSTPLHTDGNITGSASSIEVDGPATSSGSYGLPAGASVGAGSGGQQPLESVPVINPNAVYTGVDYHNAWWDLCPLGVVRLKGATPCTGTQVADSTVTGLLPGYRGWTWASVSGVDTWTMGFPDSPYSGVYYVYQGDAIVNGGTTGPNTTPFPGWNATVLAEAKPIGGPAVSCGKLGGNINWKNTNIHNFIQGMVLEAGSDLRVEGSSNHMDLGLFAAADQVYLTSSSATFMTGAVIAGDSCPNPASPSSLQGVTLYFNTTFEAPITAIIRTTQWIEFVG